MSELQHKPAGEIYEIKLQGHLNESWAGWFDGLAFTHESDGTMTLSGEIIDQAALHGLLKKVRDLGMPLLSVNRIEPDQADQAIIDMSQMSRINDPRANNTADNT
jgi:hypothetical protein